MTLDMRDIRTAYDRIGSRIVRTPLLDSPVLDDLVGGRLFVKAECLQRTGSFKFRGATNAVLSLDDESRRRGVVTFSAGNHGQALAAAASESGTPVVVVLPLGASPVKVDACRWWGAEIVTYDAESQSREDVAAAVAADRGMTVIPPFDDLRVMAGQGTVGLEIAQQLGEIGVSPDAVVLNTSGGGLSSGVITAMNSEFPGITSYITEAAGFDKMARALKSGHVEHSAQPPNSLLDALAGPITGTLPLEALRRYEIIGATVEDDETLTAVHTAMHALKLVVEPGGAAGLAAVLSKKIDVRDKTVVVVVSGGNINDDVVRLALDSRKS